VNENDPDPAMKEQPRPARLSEVFGAVFWSFFGVRKGKHMRQDVATIRPHQVIIVGIVAGAVFVATLLVIVRIVVRSAGAT
jgi:hypothetical protein